MSTAVASGANRVANTVAMPLPSSMVTSTERPRALVSVRYTACGSIWATSASMLRSVAATDIGPHPQQRVGQGGVQGAQGVGVDDQRAAGDDGPHQLVADESVGEYGGHVGEPFV